MDVCAFDDLTRVLGGGLSRRRLARALGGFLAGGSLTLGPGSSDAKKKNNNNKNKKNKKKKQKDCPGGCSGGTLCCGGGCVSVITDRNNCGTCGNACGVEQICVNTKCEPCQSPRALCTIAGQEQCVDLKTDNNSCGSCGNICTKDSNPQRDYVCQNGQCICTGNVCANGRCCPSGYTVCVAGGAGCCPTNYHTCGDGRCCPDGYTCGGNCGSECCP